MSYKKITYQGNDGVATITLNRPEAANGFDFDMGSELNHALRVVDSDESIRAVVLTGTGKFFSCGGDLKYMKDQEEGIAFTVKELADGAHQAISHMARMEKPVIVGVNGIAAGVGFSMAMYGDLVIAAKSAKFTMAYTASGLSPDGGASYILPRMIGIRRTSELMLTNRVLTADEALEWGLLNEVVADEDLSESLQKTAQTLAKGATKALATVKKLMHSTFDNSLETQMEIEGRAIAASASSPHGIEGITAFFEKRKPEFL